MKTCSYCGKETRDGYSHWRCLEEAEQLLQAGIPRQEVVATLRQNQERERLRIEQERERQRVVDEATREIIADTGLGLGQAMWEDAGRIRGGSKM